ncbi:uncharacterized protein [Argopecten irradians]|uniref:uncharacterized protein n=1 Tax=Argopecten irradians TaxID=31199 RepID=UPI00371590A9
MLKDARSAKRSVMQDLKACTERTLRISRDTDGISTYPLSRLLREVIQLTELESTMYHKIKLHIQELFPEYLIVGGSGQSTEMIATLRTFLREIANVTTSAQDRKHNVSCEDSDILRPRHNYVSTHYITYNNNQTCSGPAYGMILLPGGIQVLPLRDHLEFCGPNNTLYRNKRLRRDPEKIVYYKHRFILVESFSDSFKLIKRISQYGGRDLRFERYDGGMESSGLAVYGENVFVISKHTTLLVYSAGRTTRITLRHGRHHWANIELKNSEPGSDYGMISGEIVEQLPVLIRSSGMKVCAINNSRLSQNAYVTVNGDVYIAAPDNNRVLMFDKECHPYDEYIQLLPRHYVQDIVGLDDVILITVYDADTSERYVAIYVKGSTTSPFSFNWD